MMKATTLLALLAFLALSANAQAGYSQITTTHDLDVVIAISERVAGTAVDFDFNLHEWKELDDPADGDLSSIGERTEHVIANDIIDCIGVAMRAHFSCDLFDIGNERALFIWRNTSSFHVSGNYTIRVQWEDALAIVAESFISVRLIDPIGPTIQKKIDGFTSDCHGTGINLCINGHATALEDSALLRSLGVFAWLLIIAVMSHVTRMNRMILVVLALLPIMYVLGNLAAFEPEMLIAILIGCTAVFIALAFPQETPDRA